jgi:hypothetical protein
VSTGYGPVTTAGQSQQPGAPFSLLQRICTPQLPCWRSHTVPREPQIAMG